MEDKHHKHHEHDHLKRERHQHHRRGILRTWVFSLIQQAPRNGYELMSQIELVSQGNWRPSPGSIYPLLDQLCKEESIHKLEDGRYKLTEKGKKEFEWPYQMQTRQPRTVEGSVEELTSYVSYLEALKRMDPSKITANRDKLKNVRDRLTALIDTQ